MRICLHLLNKFLTEKFIFHALVCARKQAKNYCEEENNLFFEKLRYFFIHIFCLFLSLRNLQISYRWVFRCKVLRSLVFICLKFIPQYYYLLLCREKMVWFISYFEQGKGRNFCGIFTKSRKLCLHKIFNIVHRES